MSFKKKKRDNGEAADVAEVNTRVSTQNKRFFL